MPKPLFIQVDRRTLVGGVGALMLEAILQPATLYAQGTSPSRIGIIGSGHIGGTIGGLWVKTGHPVLFSSRHPEELKDLVAHLAAWHRPARSSRLSRLVRFFSSQYLTAHIPQIGKDYAPRCKGKFCSTPVTPFRRATAPIADEVEHDGIGVTSQKYLPGARLVRAFNTLSYMIFAREANRPDPKLAIPIAGDDPRSGASRSAAWCATPVSIRWWSASLPMRAVSSAARPGYGQNVTAAELRQKLSCRHEWFLERWLAAAHARRRRKSARPRCGRSPISSRCLPATTCYVRCAIRWASPAV